MRYLSLFSGIEAASAAWHPLGWTCAAVAEVDPDACRVLAHHFPDVPNLGDVSGITDAHLEALGPIDLVVGGSPCQDLSVAGKRAGLAGARSGLFYHQIRIFHAAKRLCGARFLLWENVPGAYSSHQGRDFATVVAAMAGLQDIDVPKNGWGTEGCALGDHGMLEWSCLDAQWFGVAQRRRRVFALLDTGDWSSRPPILLEPTSLRGDTPPSRQAGQDFAVDVAPSLRASGTGCARAGDTRGQDPVVAVVHGTQDPCVLDDTAFALGRNSGQENVIYALQAGVTRINPSSGTGVQNDVAYTLDTQSDAQIVAYPINDKASRCGSAGASRKHNDGCSNGLGIGVDGSPSFTLDTAGRHGCGTDISGQMEVRRLTSRECERLQGFADDWTRIPLPGKSIGAHFDRSADLYDRDSGGELMATLSENARYRLLGNSMAVPVMRWIGSQIEVAANSCA